MNSKPEIHEQVDWVGTGPLRSRSWACGYCGNQVASDRGYSATPLGQQSAPHVLEIRACPSCKMPTVFDARDERIWLFPTALPGHSVANVPSNLTKLYDEARRSAGAGAYTAAVMVCRSMLMHIAVEKGAKERDTFESYVQYLADHHYIPPEGKALADYIKTLGRDANHKVELRDEEDAEAAVTFVEALLRLIYELPSRIPAKVAASRPAPDRE